MKIITLTTDFGEKDYAVAAVKGAIYSLVQGALVVDISHQITPFDVLQTAYILKNAYAHFPKGSIHIIGVDAERTPERKHLLMFFDGHFFIGADNGIFNLLSENDKNTQVFEIQQNTPFSNFPVLENFPEIIAEIISGKKLEEIGKKTANYLKINAPKIQISDDNHFIYGEIIYIDHYGNCVSNIKRSFFEEIRKGRDFEIIFKAHSFKKIHNRYSDIINFNIPESNRFPDGDSLILFNSADYLQVSIYKSDLKNMGGASTLLGIDFGDLVTIRFF